MSRDYQVIAPDLRRQGDTSRPAGGYDKRQSAMVFIAVALAGIAVAIYARIDDWKAGRR